MAGCHSAVFLSVRTSKLYDFSRLLKFECCVSLGVSETDFEQNWVDNEAASWQYSIRSIIALARQASDEQRHLCAVIRTCGT